MKGDTQNGFRLGDWQVYPLRNLLVGPPGEIHIEPKVMQVLEHLASNPGQVVERDYLLHDIWDGRAFSDEPLTRCIAALRHALGDSPKVPEYIQTIPKSGYRLVCPVGPLEQATADANGDIVEASAAHKADVLTGRRRIALSTFLGLILIAASFLVYRSTLINTAESPQLTVEGTTQSEPPVYSIAVLPFRNRSAVAEDAFFVDGIHDDILMQLAKLSSLEKVISRTSMEQYRDTSKPMPQIGQELGVATILEGGVQRAGDRVRINLELIDAATDNHLWAETYDRQLTVENIFLVQEQIARDVAKTLNVTLTSQEDNRLAKVPTTSLDAYRLYHLGRQETYKVTAESLERAVEYFEEAIRLDPDYAQAYAGLALAYGQQHFFVDLSRKEALRKAKPLAERAIQLDPTLAEGYAALGTVNTWGRQWAAAESNFDTAIALNPNLAWVRMRYGTLLTQVLNRSDEGVIQLEEAARLSPLEPLVHAYLGQAYSYVHRAQDALETLHYALKIGPDNPRIYEALGDVYSYFLGRPDEAVKWYARGLERDPNSIRLSPYIATFYLDMGDIHTARLVIEQKPNVVGQMAGTKGLQLALLLYLRRYEEALKFSEEQWRQRPTGFVAHVLQTLYHSNGEYQRALEISDQWSQRMEHLVPYPETKVTGKNLGQAINRAAILAGLGENDRAHHLLNSCLKVAKTAPNPHTNFYMDTNFHLVHVYALLGDTPNALLALREAIDEGIQTGWWFDLLHRPTTASLRNEPQFQEMVEEIRADMAAQLENVRQMQRSGEIPPLPVVNH